MSSTFLRRALAGAAITATATTTLVSAPAQAASTTAPATPAAPTAVSKTRASGFEPGRVLKGTALAMHSPTKGQLWIAERTNDGKILLEHKSGRYWGSYRLNIPVGAGDTVDLHGAGNDMWLTAAGQLWHFKGRSWSKVATPGKAAATTVFDVAGPTVYVGLSGEAKNTGIYTLRNGRWSSLGRPSDNGMPAPFFSPKDVQVVGGKVFANWEASPRSATVWWNAFVYQNGSWGSPFASHSFGSGSYNHLGAWLVPNTTTQYTFGSASSVSEGLPWFARCRAWTQKAGDITCTTRFAAGAGAVLPDGRMVLGGSDYKYYTSPKVEGQFGIRTADGTERTIPGNPGDATLAMTVEPGGSTVWAATVSGKTTRLQSWNR